MYKKVGHIVVSVLLLIATTGFVSFRHYCGEELISDSIMSDQAGCCDDSPTCCHDEVESYKIDTDYLSASLSINLEQIAVEIPFIKGRNFSNPVRGTNSSYAFNNLTIPLMYGKVHSYLQVFRF